MSSTTRSERWPIGSAEGRWKGFGPYYAMFPVSFAEEYIEKFSKPGEIIIDPFCGRGTSNYVANLLGRESVGCDVNPVAWVYSKAKTDPAKQLSAVCARIDQIWESRVRADRIPVNEFQELAWSREVLAFLNCARRELNWKHSKVDWTLAGIILVYLHGKLGGGLSNQMRQSKSMAPDYAVRWWRDRHMKPPKIDPVEFIKSRVRWRYEKGILPRSSRSRIYLGDARKKLRGLTTIGANLLITSPPYMGVTNYEYDNWIRLWLLGENALPSWRNAQRYGNRENYAGMIREVFSIVKAHMNRDACIVVRTDRRQFTLETTAHTLHELWPNHQLLGRADTETRLTQTALFGDKTSKPGEVDLLLIPKRRPIPDGFLDIVALSRE